jgi:hypothetical protein
MVMGCSPDAYGTIEHRSATAGFRRHWPPPAATETTRPIHDLLLANAIKPNWIFGPPAHPQQIDMAQFKRCVIAP